jgi:dipeptide/tripeptide permease
VEFLIGTVLALSIGLLATVTGLDRDRAFYPTVMIVIALYYALFAVMSGSIRVLASESIVIMVFAGASIAGFKNSLWLVVGALAAHGVFDLIHVQLIDNPGVPSWWRDFCFAYDVVAAGYLAWLLSRSKVRAAAI